MSERQVDRVRNGLLGTGALVIVLLLVLFYSTVSGAVDRAAHRRAESVDNARLSATGGELSAGAKVASLTTASR